MSDGGHGPDITVSLDSVNATYNPVEINVAGGTQGIFIDRGLLRYNNPMSGGFYGTCHPSFKNCTPKLSVTVRRRNGCLCNCKELQGSG